MGPSGAGKDSVLRAARLLAPKHLWFAHRYITRPSDDPSENHIALSKEEFAVRKASGAFCLDWSSHGFHYGIGVEIENWLTVGNDVVVSGSRAALDHALERFPNLCPVLITADDIVLRQRLQSRGREDETAIEKRLQRNQDLAIDHSGLVTILNHGSLEEAAHKLLDVAPIR